MQIATGFLVMESGFERSKNEFVVKVVSRGTLELDKTWVDKFRARNI